MKPLKRLTLLKHNFRFMNFGFFYNNNCFLTSFIFYCKGIFSSCTLKSATLHQVDLLSNIRNNIQNVFNILLSILKVVFEIRF
jgi:hypothetical protein